MDDTMGQGEVGPYPQQGPVVSDGQWEIMIEAKLKRVTLVAYADGAIAVGAIVIGFMAFKGLTNLAKGMQQLGELTGALAQNAWPGAEVGVVDTRATAKPGSIDETPVTEGPIAEPFVGPESEASDKVKGMILGDPIKPADIGREPFREDIRVSPTEDLPPDVGL